MTPLVFELKGDCRLLNALKWASERPKVSVVEDASRLKNREYCRARRKSDPEYRARNRLRSTLLGIIKGAGRSRECIHLIGCSPVELRVHIEGLFKPGMTWLNHGAAWELDHIKPCCAFDLEFEWPAMECFHYTNLQPLWTADNRRKGSSFPC